MKPKLSRKQIHRIAGGSGVILGLYMLLILRNVKGWIPLVIGVILLIKRK